MTHDELVEALAKLACAYGTCHPEAVCSECVKAARAFIARHRLVSLPEEPDGWVDPYGIDANPVGLTLRLTVEETRGSRPVYIIPGDPQEVEP